MRIDPNAPAYPQDDVTVNRINGTGGLTIRAAMATQIMAGLVAVIYNNERTAAAVEKVANSCFNGSIEACLSTMTINYTNALIDALNGDKP